MKREGRRSQAEARRSTPQSSYQWTETEIKPKRTSVDIWLPHIAKRHPAPNYNKLYSTLNFKPKRSGQATATSLPYKDCFPTVKVFSWGSKTTWSQNTPWTTGVTKPLQKSISNSLLASNNWETKVKP